MGPVDMDQVVQTLKDMHLHGVEREEDRVVHASISEDGGGTFTITTSEDHMLLAGTYAIALETDSIDGAWVNEWNKNHSFLQLHQDEEGDPVMRVAVSGVPYKYTGVPKAVIQDMVMMLLAGIKLLLASLPDGQKTIH